MFKSSMNNLPQALMAFDISLPEKLILPSQQSAITNDSRTITSGDIFCAIIGHAQDGRQYIGTAVAKGASLVIAECEQVTEHGSLELFKNEDSSVYIVHFYQLNTHLFNLASAYYQKPQSQMKMIGITGTNGKTSTSQLLGQILSQSSHKAAVIGTNGAGIFDQHGQIALTELANTTPSATDLVQFFADFAQQDVTHIAMEVSSHALAQSRVSAELFDIAVFTNLSRDHLDYHGSMANYAAAKRKLFNHDSNQVAVLNADDEQVQTWLKDWPKIENVWLYGRSDTIKANANFVHCSNVHHHGLGVDFVLSTHQGEVKIQSPLFGDFNIDNLLAVISVLMIEGFSLETIAAQVNNIQPIAGRMESFSSPVAKSVTAVVDYAHTPDALKKALIACRQHCEGNLYVVFGCGGDRDKGKRALMAQAAEQYADNVVITSDNPRTESPAAIIKDVVAGLSSSHHATIIEARQQAVLTTLAKATEKDVVLLAGKGHENYIIIGQDKIDYDERQLVMNFFNSPNHSVGVTL